MHGRKDHGAPNPNWCAANPRGFVVLAVFVMPAAKII
jgi:hypothetical protein